jgi:hypothetical protein
VLEEVVEVAVQEVKALQGVHDLLAFAALAAVDGFDDYIVVTMWLSPVVGLVTS